MGWTGTWFGYVCVCKVWIDGDGDGDLEEVVMVDGDDGDGDRNREGTRFRLSLFISSRVGRVPRRFSLSRRCNPFNYFH